MSIAGPAPSLLAVRGHDHLQPDDFASLALYVGACVSESSSRLRCLIALDLHGNRLGDATAAAFVRALDERRFADRIIGSGRQFTGPGQGHAGRPDRETR